MSPPIFRKRRPKLLTKDCGPFFSFLGTAFAYFEMYIVGHIADYLLLPIGYKNKIKKDIGIRTCFWLRPAKESSTIEKLNQHLFGLFGKQCSFL